MGFLGSFDIYLIFFLIFIIERKGKWLINGILIFVASRKNLEVMIMCMIQVSA